VELGALIFGTTSGPKIDIIKGSIEVGWEDTKSSVVTMQQCLQLSAQNLV